MLVMGTLPLGLKTMRKVIVAALALSPMLLHAQVNSPAKTQSSANGPALQSKLNQPKAFVALAASDSNSTVSSALNGSTLTAPKLISTVEISTPTFFPLAFSQVDKIVVVSMIVGKDGKPSDLKVIHSSDLAVNRSVLTAVSQYRYQPGTLNNQPAEIPVQLEVILHRKDN